jgi:hypothetical protein
MFLDAEEKIKLHMVIVEELGYLKVTATVLKDE